MLIGVFIGVLLGLCLALGVALYLNRAPKPFVNRDADTAKTDSAQSKSAPKFEPVTYTDYMSWFMSRNYDHARQGLTNDAPPGTAFQRP